MISKNRALFDILRAVTIKLLLLFLLWFFFFSHVAKDLSSADMALHFFSVSESLT